MSLKVTHALGAGSFSPLTALKGFAAAALALMLLAAGAVPAAEAARFDQGDRARVSASRLNVRSGPGLGYQVKTGISRGEVVRVLGGPVSRNGYSWYRITGYNSRGSIGWSAGRYLQSAGSAARDSSDDSSRSVQRGRKIRVIATGYNGAEFGSKGIMRNGNRVHWGAVATDPRYIPLGTRMYISGFGNKIFKAEDTGSAIKGYKIDIWFPSVSRALQFGRQSKTITIIR
jgi:3D (Asp-Asp-Asp) domain-containing protein